MITSVPIITLTTDFGLLDPYVGVMKGRILARCPLARVIDLTHGVPPGRADIGGLLLARTAAHFPPGTIHVAVVDPDVCTDRPILVAEAGDHRFIAPDNGLLDEVFRQIPPARVHRLDPDTAVGRNFGPVSATFHGRDLLAPVAADLAAGTTKLAALGPAAETWAESDLPRPRHSPGSIACPVIFTDHYGNLITSAPAETLEGISASRIEFAGRDVPLCRTYADVASGAPLALINSYGLLEVAVRDERAAGHLDAHVGDVVVIHVIEDGSDCYSG